MVVKYKTKLMKKVLLSLLLLYVTFWVSAQTDYKYLKEQWSPFYGDFLEPRYEEVDSIVLISYYSDIFGDTSVSATVDDWEEIPPGFEKRVSYSLIKRSDDGLVDTFEYHGRKYRPEVTKSINKYSPDGKLIYTTSFPLINGNEINYAYDEKGRILEMKQKYYGEKGILDESVRTYDYDKNMIISRFPEYIIYTDSGYIIKQPYSLPKNDEMMLVPDSVISEYIFDEKNRLIRVRVSVPASDFLPEGDSKIVSRETLSLIDFKYTNNGYEKYEYDSGYIQKSVFVFQKDGYCKEKIIYQMYPEELDGKDGESDELYIDKIDRYFYYRKGQDVSSSHIEVSPSK